MKRDTKVKHHALLEQVESHLLEGKTWQYLRYLHAREALRCAHGVASVLVVGAGRGLAELALALEFPHVHFTLTDWSGATHRRSLTEGLASKYAIDNLSSEPLDILRPESTAPHDLVYSVEVLEHIKDDSLAAANMLRLANHYVFCLVPFAEDAVNASKRRRQRVLEAYEHHVCGYDAKRLLALFPNPVALRGCYWEDVGGPWRKRMKGMTPHQIAGQSRALRQQAQEDLKPLIPVTQRDAQGIWCLSQKLHDQ